jgi:hypothetical protein
LAFALPAFEGARFFALLGGGASAAVGSADAGTSARALVEVERGDLLFFERLLTGPASGFGSGSIAASGSGGGPLPLSTGR